MQIETKPNWLQRFTWKSIFIRRWRKTNKWRKQHYEAKANRLIYSPSTAVPLDLSVYLAGSFHRAAPAVFTPGQGSGWITSCNCHWTVQVIKDRDTKDVNRTTYNLRISCKEQILTVMLLSEHRLIKNKLLRVPFYPGPSGLLIVCSSAHSSNPPTKFCPYPVGDSDVILLTSSQKPGRFPGLRAEFQTSHTTFHSCQRLGKEDVS